jgi:hypothetical protein
VCDKYNRAAGLDEIPQRTREGCLARSVDAGGGFVQYE